MTDRGQQLCRFRDHSFLPPVSESPQMATGSFVQKREVSSRLDRKLYRWPDWYVYCPIYCILGSLGNMNNLCAKRKPREHVTSLCHNMRIG